MKTVILDAATLGDDIDLTLFDEFGETKIYRQTPPEQTAERIKNADFVIINKIKLNETNLKYADNLKLICIAATGFDNVDTDYCRRCGIAVSNVVGYSTNCVSQLTIAMALSLITHLPEYNCCTESGEYTRSGVQNCLTPVYHEIAGKTWGIVGYGNIGKKVGSIAEALGCNVIVNKKNPDGLENFTDIDTLCRNSDIISIHTPLNSATKNLINKERIAMMKPNAIVINVARGAVVDEAALCSAVKSGAIGGIGVDVYTTEPYGDDSPYAAVAGLDNVCLTPHMAWGAYEARIRCINEIKLNIKAFLEGKERNRV